MRHDDPTPSLLRAALAGIALLLASGGLLAISNAALDATAVAGGIGVVMAGSLLALVLLVARWRAAHGGYVSTNMASDDRSAYVAEAFDDPNAATSAHDDAAAM